MKEGLAASGAPQLSLSLEAPDAQLAGGGAVAKITTAGLTLQPL